ncbi:MAG TPA: transporter substrate-binding domain-containing protein [Pseudonocardia sp.]|jgi:polar amino acid transport system substrate-binding protein|nr:transporter substrate-binding domain-containing protein [Pseudonocardia sp.]
MRTRLSRRWGVALGIAILVCMVGSVPASATPAARDATGAAGEVLKVGIKPLDPFVARDVDRYRGFSIDLWNEIARRNGWQTDYVWHDTLPQLLDDVRTGAVDVGISGITITKAREETLDFSYPMFSAGLQVMIRPRAGSTSWPGEITEVLTAGIGRYLLVLIAALVIAGHVIWLATRRRTGRAYLRGVATGIYQAAGLGLVGDYGVADPQRPLARAAAVIWTIVGISFVSLFTAALASQLTVSSIQNKITGVHDLAGTRVLTVGGTSSEDYLRQHSIAYTRVATINDAYVRLDAGQADAIVFDAPVLQNRITVTHSSAEVLAGDVFARENYGIAVPTGSPLRKKINTTLLDLIEDGTYEDLYARYFAENGSG